MGGCGGAGDVAAHGGAADPGTGIEGEKAVVGVARLLLQSVQVQAAAIDPGWSAGLEAVGDETQLSQGFGQTFGGLFAGATRRHRAVAHPDAASQEGARGEDHSAGGVGAAEIGANPHDAGGWGPGARAGGWISLDEKPGDHRLPQVQVGRVLQQLQHLAGVLALVCLGPQGPDSRAAAGIEHPLLQGGGVGKATDDTT